MRKGNGVLGLIPGGARDQQGVWRACGQSGMRMPWSGAGTGWQPGGACKSDPTCYVRICDVGALVLRNVLPARPRVFITRRRVSVECVRHGFVLVQGEFCPFAYPDRRSVARRTVAVVNANLLCVAVQIGGAGALRSAQRAACLCFLPGWNVVPLSQSSYFQVHMFAWYVYCESIRSVGIGIASAQ